MIELTMREYDTLPTIYDDEDNINDIRNLDIGDRYIIRMTEEYVDKGSIVSIYEVVQKRTDLRVESKILQAKII